MEINYLLLSVLLSIASNHENVAFFKKNSDLIDIILYYYIRLIFKQNNENAPF